LGQPEQKPKYSGAERTYKQKFSFRNKEFTGSLRSWKGFSPFLRDSTSLS
jgi:hypothetical protein